MPQRYTKEKTFKRLPMSQPASSLTKLPTVVTIEIMKFTWDEAKRLSNIEKHGIDFADVPPMFDGDVFSIEDQRFDYGETRYITFGLLQFRVIVVAHTDENDVIRIISARKATKNEEKLYFQEIGH
jgi:uncharacterized DUF497 family protein